MLSNTPPEQVILTPQKKKPTSNVALVFACFQRNVKKPVTMSYLVTQTGLTESQVTNACKHLRSIRKENIVRHKSTGGDYFIYQVKVEEKAETPKQTLRYSDVFKAMNELGAA
ncbi:hypothetical protein G6Z94_11685 [Vibrio aestuarianus]|uniref:hypothetical protein n=1 Tax=Vibrio aestuarianus TaxID=28171 RepID=UPI001592CC42|nr:hypothetical protein [Vibrio aestuarianus]NGZ18000.1 hypothetical protein [Vibrio aestuarianus]